MTNNTNNVSISSGNQLRSETDFEDVVDLQDLIAQDEILNAEVIDVIGKIIYKEVIHAQSGIHAIPMNLHHLAKGIYSLIVSGSKGNAVKRFVIE